MCVLQPSLLLPTSRCSISKKVSNIWLIEDWYIWRQMVHTVLVDRMELFARYGAHNMALYLSLPTSLVDRGLHTILLDFNLSAAWQKSKIKKFSYRWWQTKVLESSKDNYYAWHCGCHCCSWFPCHLLTNAHKVGRVRHIGNGLRSSSDHFKRRPIFKESETLVQTETITLWTDVNDQTVSVPNLARIF